MIPAGITYDHVVMAIDEVDRDGVPWRRKAIKWEVRFRRNTYPPKLLVSYACRYATGRELPSADFSGGLETYNVLWRLGFMIGRIGSR